MLWAVIVAAVLLAAGLSAWALSANDAHHNPPVSTTTTTTAPTTTTTAPTTTTTAPTATSSAAALLTDIQTGANNGSISAGAAQSLRDDLNQALSASASGDSNQATQAVDAMIGTINDEVQKGTMTEAESSLLFSDVNALANVLGVSTTAPTTTAPGADTGNTANTGNTGNTGAGGHGGHAH
jgi:FIMAH domain